MQRKSTSGKQKWIISWFSYVFTSIVLYLYLRNKPTRLVSSLPLSRLSSLDPCNHCSKMSLRHLRIYSRKSPYSCRLPALHRHLLHPRLLSNLIRTMLLSICSGS